MITEDLGMIAIAAFMFFGIWFLMFFYQFRSPQKYNGRIDMKEYAFCSNLIVSFPSALIAILFFNKRLVRLPATIVICQIVNVVMFCIFAVSTYCFDVSLDMQFLELRIWFALVVLILVAMVIDHEIFCHKNK